jgi:microcystin-dependent protein
MNKGALAGATTDSPIPAGVVWEFAGDVTAIPDGWLLADGSAVSRSQYPKLFKAIGVLHGAGNGTTTFNLPNRQGRVGVGKDGTTEFAVVGQTGGEKAHVILATELAAHNHVINISENVRDLNHWHDHSHTHALEVHDHTISHYHTAYVGNVKAWSGFSHQHVNSGGYAAEGAEQGASGAGTIPVNVDGNAYGASNGTNRSSWWTNAQGRGAAEGTTTGWPLTDRYDPNHAHGVSATSNNNTPTGTAHNNLQPYTVVNYMVKY